MQDLYLMHHLLIWLMIFLFDYMMNGLHIQCFDISFAAIIFILSIH